MRARPGLHVLAAGLSLSLSRLQSLGRSAASRARACTGSTFARST